MRPAFESRHKMPPADHPPPLPPKDYAPSTRLEMSSYDMSVLPQHDGMNDRDVLRRKDGSSYLGEDENDDSPEGEGLLNDDFYQRNTIGPRRYHGTETKVKLQEAWRYFRTLFFYMIGLPVFAYGAYTLFTKSSNNAPDPFVNWGKPGTTSEGLSWYPTNFLRDVIPIACHSHNDYWRKVPLFSALYAGCIGTEADVWDFGGQHLFVGHNNAALTANRTFLSLYIDPLVKILERQNPKTDFYNGSSHGVFDTDHEQSLTLLVDLKTDGPTTWPRVLQQLESLRKRGWLSFVENGVVHKRPITVVGTGETPFNVLTANTTYRDAFFDAPLGTFWKEPAGQAPSSTTESTSKDASAFIRRQSATSGQGNAGTSVTDDYNPTNSYYASASFFDLIGVPWRFGKLSEKQLYKLRGHIAGAHEKGLKVRLWDTPAWPRSLREGIWRLLVDEGVDILNVDDLERAKSGLW